MISLLTWRLRHRWDGNGGLLPGTEPKIELRCGIDPGVGGRALMLHGLHRYSGSDKTSFRQMEQNSYRST